MKKIFIIIIITCLSIASLAFFVYYPSLDTGLEASVNIDKTDSFKSKPLLQELYTTFDIERNKWSRIILRLNSFSDFEYNSFTTLELPAQFLIFSSPIRRDTAITQFKSNLNTGLIALNNLKKGRPRSSIYIPMITEVNRLSKSKAKRRLAFFYTDCSQNMKDFSVYRKKDLDFLRQHPDSVRLFFEQLKKPDDLYGIKVYFIFEPTSPEESETYNLMSNVFRNILEKARAEVYVGANLPTE